MKIPLGKNLMWGFTKWRHWYFVMWTSVYLLKAFLPCLQLNNANINSVFYISMQLSWDLSSSPSRSVNQRFLMNSTGKYSSRGVPYISDKTRPLHSNVPMNITGSWYHACIKKRIKINVVDITSSCVWLRALFIQLLDAVCDLYVKCKNLTTTLCRQQEKPVYFRFP